MKTRAGKTRGEKARISQRRIVKAGSRKKEEKDRNRALAGGQPNELGVLQGQNAEQGNTLHPRNTRPLGKLSH